MGLLPVLKSVTLCISRVCNPTTKTPLKELYRYTNPLVNLTHSRYASTSKSRRPIKNEQKIIESNFEEDKLNSRAIIEKVNDHIASGNAGRLFAVIYAQGELHRVAKEDILIIARNYPPTQFDNLVFEKVLLVGGSSFTLIGKPMLPSNLVRVRGAVVNKDLTHTRIRYRHKSGLRIHKLNFVREDLTYIRITDIELYPKVNLAEDSHYLRA